MTDVIEQEMEFVRSKRNQIHSIDDYVDMLILAVETAHRMNHEGGEPTLPDSQ